MVVVRGGERREQNQQLLLDRERVSEMIIICFSIVANAICVSLCVECGAAWRHCQTLLAYLEAALLGWCLRECDNGINSAQRQHTLDGSSLLLTRKDSGEAGGREHPINVLEVTKVKVNGGREEGDVPAVRLLILGREVLQPGGIVKSVLYWRRNGSFGSRKSCCSGYG